ncbi:hypothetical protein [Haloferula sp. BvORR071]|uniref:hypothetical protein n=1 Tax=Haloferula sp. BvORR071 TaxID=1396141 RepID=UPI000555E30A|nr:hypothetical protein [Haloferula sp. BvORR071]
MIPTRIPVAIACCLLAVAASSCRAPIEEQDAIRKLAADTRPLTAAEVSSMPQEVSLGELEQKFGRGEPQSGNRLAYRSSDKDKFFWVYPYNPPTGSGPMVHHIVLADRLEEKGKIVWPEKYRKTPPATAAYMVSQM